MLSASNYVMQIIKWCHIVNKTRVNNIRKKPQKCFTIQFDLFLTNLLLTIFYIFKRLIKFIRFAINTWNVIKPNTSKHNSIEMNSIQFNSFFCFQSESYSFFYSYFTFHTDFIQISKNCLVSSANETKKLNIFELLTMRDNNVGSNDYRTYYHDGILLLFFKFSFWVGFFPYF